MDSIHIANGSDGKAGGGELLRREFLRKSVFSNI